MRKYFAFQIIVLTASLLVFFQNCAPMGSFESKTNNNSSKINNFQREYAIYPEFVDSNLVYHEEGFINVKNCTDDVATFSYRGVEYNRNVNCYDYEALLYLLDRNNLELTPLFFGLGIGIEYNPNHLFVLYDNHWEYNRFSMFSGFLTDELGHIAYLGFSGSLNKDFDFSGFNNLRQVGVSEITDSDADANLASTLNVPSSIENFIFGDSYPVTTFDLTRLPLELKSLTLAHLEITEIDYDLLPFELEYFGFYGNYQISSVDVSLLPETLKSLVYQNDLLNASGSNLKYLYEWIPLDPQFMFNMSDLPDTLEVLMVTSALPDDNFSSLPRSLEMFMNFEEGFDWGSGDPPPNLKHLYAGTRSGYMNISGLPEGLISLYIDGEEGLEESDLALLPEGLKHLILRKLQLSNYTFYTLPKKLRTLIAVNKDDQILNASLLPRDIETLKIFNVGSQVEGTFPPHLISLGLNGSLNSLDTAKLPRGLEYLLLPNNQLTSFNANNLPPSLKRLNLALNQLTSFESSQLPRSLSSLELQDNKLTSINNSMFNGLNRFYWFEIQYNNICEQTLPEICNQPGLSGVLDCQQICE